MNLEVDQKEEYSSTRWLQNVWTSICERRQRNLRCPSSWRGQKKKRKSFQLHRCGRFPPGLNLQIMALSISDLANLIASSHIITVTPTGWQYDWPATATEHSNCMYGRLRNVALSCTRTPVGCCFTAKHRNGNRLYCYATDWHECNIIFLQPYGTMWPLGLSLYKSGFSFLNQNEKLLGQPSAHKSSLQRKKSTKLVLIKRAIWPIKLLQTARCSKATMTTVFSSRQKKKKKKNTAQPQCLQRETRD